MLSRIMRVMELAAVSRCAGGLNNQDDVFAGVVVTEGGLAVPVIAVADGVGGNLGGSEASRAAMRTLLALVRGSSARTREELLAGIDCWQPELDAAVAASTKGSATTFTACLLPEDRPLVIHIGDTRAVWLSLSGQGVPLTEDHNELAAAIRSGLREEDIRSIHYRTLTRALGMRKSSAWDVLDLPLFEEPGWLVIVCDGVYRAQGFGMAELLKLALSAQSAKDLAGSMVREAAIAAIELQPAGKIAARTVIPADSAPARQFRDNVTLWLAPKVHVVHYPVRGGKEIAVVVVRRSPGGIGPWSGTTNEPRIVVDVPGS